MATLPTVRVKANTWTLVYDAALSGDFDGTVSTTNANGAFIITGHRSPGGDVFGTYFANQQPVSIRGTEKVYIRMTNEDGIIVLDDSLLMATRSQSPASIEDIDGLSKALSGKMDSPTGKVSEYLRGDGSPAPFPTSMPPDAHSHSIGDVNGLQFALNSKFPAPSGSVQQYVRGDGSIAAFPASMPPTAHTHSMADVTGLQSALNGKYDKPTGSTGQYLRGDGTPAAFPSIPAARRIETYTANTDANGLVTVTYATPFAAIPNVQPGPPPSADMAWILVSSTVNGFSVRLVQRAVLTVLSVQVLAGLVTNVANSPARILVVES